MKEANPQESLEVKNLPRKKEPLSANRTIDYHRDPEATDKFETGGDVWITWIDKNESRLAEAIVNPDNENDFKHQALDYLINNAANDKDSKHALQLAYVAKYGSGELQVQAKQAMDDYESVYGKFPDVVDPAREAKKEVEKASSEVVKKAASEDYQVLNDIFKASLSNVLEAPLASMPKNWYQVKNELLDAIESKNIDQYVNHLCAYAKESDLSGLKLTLELLQKYAAGEIKNANAPDGQKNAEYIYARLGGKLSDQINAAKKEFENGDYQALQGVIGYQAISDLTYSVIGSKISEANVARIKADKTSKAVQKLS